MPLIGTYVCDCKESDLLNSIKVQRGQLSADASFFNSVDVPVSPLFMCEQYEEDKANMNALGFRRTHGGGAQKLVRMRNLEQYRTLRHRTDYQNEFIFRISETRIVPDVKKRSSSITCGRNTVGSSREEYLRSFKFSKQTKMRDRIQDFLCRIRNHIHVVTPPCGCLRSLPISQSGGDSKLGTKNKKLRLTSESRSLEKRGFSNSFFPSALLNSILLISANPLFYLPHMPPYF